MAEYNYQINTDGSPIPRIIGIVLFLSGLGILGYNSQISTEKKREQFEQTKYLAAQIYRIAAGQDKLLDDKEKNQLLNDLSLDAVVDQTEALIPSPNIDGLIHISATKGHRNRELGTITQDQAKRYMKTRQIEPPQ